MTAAPEIKAPPVKVKPKKSPTDTRTVRFEVTFAGRRRAQIIGDHGIYKVLWGISRDLTRAANKLVSAMWQVRLGTMPKPVDPDGKEIHLQTLSYQGMSGKWQPFGEPMYATSAYYSEVAAALKKKGKKVQPDIPGRTVGSGVLLDTAGTVYTRLKTDFLDITLGKRALSSFRSMPIGVVGKCVKVTRGPDGFRIVMTLFPVTEEKKNRIVTLRPRKIDPGQAAILQRIVDGEVNHGSTKLCWKKRPGAKGRWFVAMSWTTLAAKAPEEEHGVIASAHLGITNTAVMAYVDQATGEVQKWEDRVHFPFDVQRTWDRICAERRACQAGGRRGHLRGDDAMARFTKDAARKLACNILKQAKKRKAVQIVWDDLQEWSVNKAHAQADDLGTRRQQASFRKWYFTWRQGLTRECLANVCKREGMPFRVVDTAFGGRTCGACGAVYKQPTTGEDGEKLGRYEWRSFRCACGWEATADRNHSIVLAQRGWRTRNDAKVDDEDEAAEVNE